MWGLVTGTLYFIMLLAASWISGGIDAKAAEIITTMLLCLGGGMLGGMLA